MCTMKLAVHSNCDINSGCAHQSDHFNDDNHYNLAPSDFDHYQEDPEFKNGGTGIEEDMVMDQRDQNMRDSSMAGMS